MGLWQNIENLDIERVAYCSNPSGHFSSRNISVNCNKSMRCLKCTN